jgi:hypothetical protein
MKFSEVGRKLSPEISAKKSSKDMRGWKVPIHIVSDSRDESSRLFVSKYSFVVEKDDFPWQVQLCTTVQWLGSEI